MVCCMMLDEMQLNTTLYQLHTLSFILAPSLLGYLCRCATQFQFAKPRVIDARRSLVFWFVIVGAVNMGSVWTHVVVGAPDVDHGGAGARGVVLDFVGMGT